jgi:hypothetical protein
MRAGPPLAGTLQGGDVELLSGQVFSSRTRHLRVIEA